MENPDVAASCVMRERGGWAREVALRFAWAPLLVFILDSIFWVFHVYSQAPWIDAPIHFVGGIAITWFALGAARVATRRDLIGRPNHVGLLVIAFLAGTSASVFWEFVEFLTDRYLGTTSQVDLVDTLNDMFLGVAGAALQIGVASRLFGTLRSPTAD